MTALRPATLDDAAAVAELARAYEASLGLPPETDAVTVEEWWSRVELERDSWLLFDDERLVAYATMHRRADSGDAHGFTAPDRRELFTRLLELSEETATGSGMDAVRFGLAALDTDATAQAEARGYRPVRRFFEMTIDLADAPEAEDPDGARIERFEPDDARPFFDVLTAAFAGHWGFEAPPFEEWLRTRVEAQDTSLWFVARAGDEIVGAVRNIPEHRGKGFVGILAVHPSSQGRGIGRALLRRSFAEFHRRGIHRVGLGVDSENPNATRLYESVGMRVLWEEVVHEKSLG